MADDHEHDDDQDHHHDGDHDHDSGESGGFDIEVSPERLARLDVELATLSVADIDAGMRVLPVEARRTLVQRVGIKLDPRFMKGGMGKLVKGRIARLDTRGKLELAGDLTSGLERESIDVLGEASFETPSSEDVERLVDHLAGKWSVPLVRTYLACTAAAAAPVADQLDALLDDDPRLKA